MGKKLFAKSWTAVEFTSKPYTKRFGYCITVVGALMFNAGVVNSSFVSPVMAEEEKEKTSV